MRIFAFGERLWLVPYLIAVGVGNDVNPVTSVRGADGCRWDAIPFRIKPALGQVPENSSEPQGKVPWDVLQKRETGS